MTSVTYTRLHERESIPLAQVEAQASSNGVVAKLEAQASAEGSGTEAAKEESRTPEDVRPEESNGDEDEDEEEQEEEDSDDVCAIQSHLVAAHSLSRMLRSSWNPHHGHWIFGEVFYSCSELSAEHSYITSGSACQQAARPLLPQLQRDVCLHPCLMS